MFPEFRQTTVTALRRDIAREVAWVHDTGGQLFVSTHGRHLAALVPIWHAKLLADVEAWTVREMRERQERALEAWSQMRHNAGYAD